MNRPIIHLRNFPIGMFCNSPDLTIIFQRGTEKFICCSCSVSEKGHTEVASLEELEDHALDHMNEGDIVPSELFSNIEKMRSVSNEK